MIGISAAIMAGALPDILSIAAVVLSLGVGINSLYGEGKREAVKNTARLTKLEEEVKELSTKHSTMVTNVDKLTDSLGIITTKQAITETKIDQLQNQMESLQETCTKINENLHAFKLSINESFNTFKVDNANEFGRIRTEIGMISSRKD